MDFVYPSWASWREKWNHKVQFCNCDIKEHLKLEISWRKKLSWLMLRSVKVDELKHHDISKVYEKIGCILLIIFIVQRNTSLGDNQLICRLKRIREEVTLVGEIRRAGLRKRSLGADKTSWAPFKNGFAILNLVFKYFYPCLDSDWVVSLRIFVFC